MRDGWCVECGDAFHLDDCGGYNPPCPCGCGLCRSCCAGNEYDDESPEPDDGDDFGASSQPSLDTPG